MTVFFAASETESFNPGATARNYSHAGGYEPSYGRSSLGASTNATYRNEAVLDAALTEGWFHVHFFAPHNASNTNTYFMGFLDSNGSYLFGLASPPVTTDGVAVLCIGDPATTLTKFAATTIPLSGAAVAKDIDINYKCALEGWVDLYVDGVLITRLTGDTRPTDGYTAVKSVLMRGVTGATTTDCSQVIIADTTTIGAKVHSLVPTSYGVGGTDWSGSISNINSNAANPYLSNVQGYNVGDKLKVKVPSLGIAVREGFHIEQVRHAYLMNTAGTPTSAKIKPLVDDGVSATDHVGSTDFVMSSTAYVRPSFALNVDPLDGEPWTAARVAACEYGVMVTEYVA